MAETYAVSLWDGPDDELVVRVVADDPRDAATKAAQENPGFDPFFVYVPGSDANEILCPPCDACGRYLLLGDDFSMRGNRTYCERCVPAERSCV